MKITLFLCIHKQCRNIFPESRPNFSFFQRVRIRSFTSCLFLTCLSFIYNTHIRLHFTYTRTHKAIHIDLIWSDFCPKWWERVGWLASDRPTPKDGIMMNWTDIRGSSWVVFGPPGFDAMVISSVFLNHLPQNDYQTMHIKVKIMIDRTPVHTCKFRQPTKTWISIWYCIHRDSSLKKNDPSAYRAFSI